jgi:hypothetical protein
MVAHCYCSNLVVSRQLIAVDGIPTIGALAYICSRILVSVLCKTTNPVFTSCRGRVVTPPGGSGRRSHPVGLGDEVSKVWFLAVAGKELVEAGAAFAHDKGAPTHDSCLRHNRRLDSLAVVLLREAKALEGGWGVRRAHRGALLAGLASLSQIEHLPVPPCRGVRS